MENLEISVVVLTRNRRDDLKRCLDSLMKQTYRDFELIVIDNGSTDDTPALLKGYPVRVIRDEMRNLAFLFNLAWRNASHEIVAYIADDAEADPSWLGHIMETFRAFEEAAAVGGPTISTRKQEMHLLYEVAQRSRLLSLVAKIYEIVILENRLRVPGFLSQSGAYSMGAGLITCLGLEHPISVDLLTTTGMAIRKSALQRLRGFDENFFFNHADGDLFVRIRKAGYKLIFNPKATVWHHVRTGPSRDVYYLGRDTAYFYMKDIRPETPSGWLRFMLNIIYFNMYWLYKGLQTKDLHFLRGFLAFASGISYYLKTRQLLVDNVPLVSILQQRER